MPASLASPLDARCRFRKAVSRIARNDRWGEPRGTVPCRLAKPNWCEFCTAYKISDPIQAPGDAMFCGGRLRPGGESSSLGRLAVHKKCSSGQRFSFRKTKRIKCSTFVACCLGRALSFGCRCSRFAVACNDFWTPTWTFSDEFLEHLKAIG